MEAEDRDALDKVYSRNLTFEVLMQIIFLAKREQRRKNLSEETMRAVLHNLFDMAKENIDLHFGGKKLDA